MKIDGLDPLKNKPSGKSRETESVQGGSFKDILDNLAAKARSSAQTAGTGPAAPVSQVPFIASADGGVSESAAIGRLEGLLTDLSMFSNALGNEAVPIERLSPMIDELAARRDELAAMIGKMPDGELKNIAGQTLSLLIEQVSIYHAGYAA